MALFGWLRRLSRSLRRISGPLEGEDAEGLKRAYARESALKALKTGRMASFLAIVGLPYFIWQDIYILKLNVWAWRVLGTAPFPLFALASFTILPRRLELVRPAYGASLCCFMAMMSGLLAQAMADPGSAEYLRYLLVNALVVAMLIAFVFAGGVERALPLILFGPFTAASAYILTASALPSDHFAILANVAAVAIALSFLAAFRERLAFNEFRMRLLAERRGAIISEQNGELAALNAELEGALGRLAADLDDKRRTEERILRDRSILQAFLDAVAEPAFVVDSEFLVQFANHSFAAKLGRDFDSIAGRPLSELIPSQFERYHRRTIETVRTSGAPVHVETESDGRIVENTVYPIYIRQGQPAFFGVLGKDITERKRSESALADMAARDALTGLYNRRSMHGALKEAIAKAGKGHRASFLYLDLDRFKIVNDRKGHEAGDEILQTVAAMFCSSVRGEDAVYRIGGDEFAIILDGMGAVESVRILERLRKALSQRTFTFDDESFDIGLSAGIVEIRGGVDQAVLLAEADEAMYEDKRARRAPSPSRPSASEGPSPASQRSE